MAASLDWKHNYEDESASYRRISYNFVNVCRELHPLVHLHAQISHDLVTRQSAILFGHLRVDSSQFFIASDDKRTRGHNYKLRVPIAKTDARKHFFSCRIVKIWNELPKTVNFLAHEVLETVSKTWTFYRIVLDSKHAPSEADRKIVCWRPSVTDFNCETMCHAAFTVVFSYICTFVCACCITVHC